jgi:serine phosphatase RsbU (regulator of sigma subunit)
LEFFTADKYISLPRSAAYNKFLDDKNLKSFRAYLVVAIVFLPLNLLTDAIGNFSIGVMVVMLINIAFLVITRIKYKRLLNSDNIRKFLYTYLIAQIVFACLINFTNIAAGPGEDTDAQNLLPDSSAVSDSSPDSLNRENLGSTNKDKDTVWVSKKGNMQVTVDLSNNYDTFAEWLLILSIMLIIFSFPRDELYKIWALALVFPIISEFIIYGNLEIESYLAYGSFYALFFIIAFLTEMSTRKKFNKQYDFYLKKNFENIRMKKELDSAKEIQLSMLPESNSVINSIDISGISLPAKEVGGDYFDYFRLSDTKLGVFICDVSGHGVASGLMLSGLRSCMHLILEDEDDPRIVMEKLNRMVRKTQQRKMFVTAVFALIDTGKGECRLFNAGHLPPYKISESAGEIFKIKKHGITLGAIDNISIPNHESEVVFDFNRGDKIVFYTDGLSEAMNKTKQEYGFERIENILQRNTEKSPLELIDILNNDVRNFIGESEQIDDLTILIIGRK